MSLFIMNFYYNMRKIFFNNNNPFLISKLSNLRPITTSTIHFDEETPEEKTIKRKGYTREVEIHTVDTSKSYLKSKAYKEAYGTSPVWVPYRRNHKGPFAPLKTRKTCVRGGLISTGNPCPICRDDYLVLHHENVDLLKQFISPQTGEILSYGKTGLCQRKHKELLIAIERAKDYGTLTFDVPFRAYNYSDYIKN